MLISVKNTTHFVLTTFLYDDFFLTALLVAVKLVNKSAVIVVSAASITLSDAPRTQDNLSKLLTALSTIAALSAVTLTKNVHKF